VAYWERFGDRIAEAAPETAAQPAVPGVQVRTVRARPEIARALDPRDLNIVLQRFAGRAAGEQFDLIVATDILLYYDVFEQSLALANIAAMLRPGGLFLTNATLFELPVLPIGSIGYNDVMYLESPEIGDRLVWYRRQ
jgi:chemotaxis methyl-accepting protein methylase